MTDLYRCDIDARTGRDVFTRATDEEIAAACPEVGVLQERVAELRQHAEAMADDLEEFMDHMESLAAYRAAFPKAPDAGEGVDE